jgi:hypothetical protein
MTSEGRWYDHAVRTAAIGLLVTACAPVTTPPLAHHTAIEEPTLRGGPMPLVERRLSVGSHDPASRMIWELSIGKRSASLVVIEQEAPGCPDIATARSDPASAPPLLLPLS